MITIEQAITNTRGTWNSFTCPVHPDNSPSARVNVASRRWVCMSCGAKGFAGEVKFNPDLALEMTFKMLESSETRTYPESWWDRFDSYQHPYWLNRFKPEMIGRYRLGYDSEREKPCYPLWDANEQIIGPVHRSVDGLGPKYRYPRGSHTASLLFGVRELDQSKILFLVEGAMDVIAAREAGYDAVGSYGSRLYEGQIKALKRLGARRVVVAYDHDRAGHRGAADAIRDLGRAGVLAYRLHWQQDANDLGEMNIETRRNVMANT